MKKKIEMRNDFGFKDIAEVDFMQLDDAEQTDYYEEAIDYIEWLENRILDVPPAPPPDNTARTAEIKKPLTVLNDTYGKDARSTDVYYPLSIILSAMEIYASQFKQQDSKEVTEKCPICGNPNNDCDKIF